ncbi:hypothetical protein EDB83DRAFT_2453757 [Lactarius deliciosus]|nr:hypothetical protein EDB83DRAFT_2453757 [Lactarius deliciosus]
MGKGGAGDRELSRAPFSRVRRGAAKGKRRGWGGWGEGAAGPRTPPVRANGAARRGGADSEWRSGVPPSAQMGKGGRGVACPFRAYSVARPRGKGRGKVPMRPLSARMGCAELGKGERRRRRHALVRPPSAQTWRCGRGRKEGGRGAVGIVCPLPACEGGGGGQCGGRKGWVGDLPSCASLCARCGGRGRRPALLRPL